jgi:hypothetical protein
MTVEATKTKAAAKKERTKVTVHEDTAAERDIAAFRSKGTLPHGLSVKFVALCSKKDLQDLVEKLEAAKPQTRTTRDRWMRIQLERVQRGYIKAVPERVVAVSTKAASKNGSAKKAAKKK